MRTPTLGKTEMGGMCLNVLGDLWCPNCTCSDGEGRSNEVEGGVLSRMGTITATCEFQKKRDEHVHMQCVIECPRTSHTMEEIVDLIAKSSKFVEEYTHFADSTCAQKYFCSTLTAEEDHDKAESTWPEHKEQRRLPAIPGYFNLYDAKWCHQLGLR